LAHAVGAGGDVAGCVDAGDVGAAAFVDLDEAGFVERDAELEGQLCGGEKADFYEYPFHGKRFAAFEKNAGDGVLAFDLLDDRARANFHVRIGLKAFDSYRLGLPMSRRCPDSLSRDHAIRSFDATETNGALDRTRLESGKESGKEVDSKSEVA